MLLALRKEEDRGGRSVPPAKWNARSLCVALDVGAVAIDRDERLAGDGVAPSRRGPPARARRPDCRCHRRQQRRGDMEMEVKMWRLAVTGVAGEAENVAALHLLTDLHPRLRQVQGARHEPGRVAHADPESGI